jgi:hypothetical protein
VMTEMCKGILKHASVFACLQAVGDSHKAHSQPEHELLQKMPSNIDTEMLKKLVKKRTAEKPNAKDKGRQEGKQNSSGNTQGLAQ